MVSNSDLRLDAVPYKLRKGATELAEILRRVGGESLKSHTVFGKALMSDYAEGVDSLESVAVFAEVDLDLIHSLAIEGEQLGRYRVQAPLIMTPRYIADSCDAFPVELLEIQQVNTVVTGGNFFSDLVFERGDMRLQCERELKRGLIQLRQGLLASAGRDHLLPGLTQGVMAQAMRVLRALLWLWDRPCPNSTMEMVSAVESAGKLSLGGLSGVVQRPGEDPYVNLGGVYNDLERLARHVNEMAD